MNHNCYCEAPDFTIEGKSSTHRRYRCASCQGVKDMKDLIREPGAPYPPKDENFQPISTSSSFSPNASSINACSAQRRAAVSSS